MLVFMKHFLVFCILGLFATASASAETLLDENAPIFISIRLPYGLSVELPQSWQVFTGENKEALTTLGLAELDLSQMLVPASHALIRATATPADHPASIFIAYQSQSPITPTQAAELTATTLADYDPDLRNAVEQQMHPQGITLVEWSGTRQDQIDGQSVLVSEYLRKNPNTPTVREQINLIPLAYGMVLLSVTYNEQAGDSWRSMVMRIRSSCRIHTEKNS